MHQNLNLFMAIVALVCFDNTLVSQNRWVHQYHSDTDAPVEFIIESYDKGYFLSGKHGANYSRYNWLIKTDINGEVLWEKTIGDGESSIVFLDMAQDATGNLYLGGSTGAYDPERDPLIMKIDSCGEKEWCKVFYTEDNHDFLSCLTLTPDDEIVLVLLLTNPDHWVDRICLANLSSTGDLHWKECYSSADTSQRNEVSLDVIQTPDNGFLISGYCDYEDPEQPNKWWVKPYYLKVDSIGVFEWETVLYKETNLDGGIAYNTVVNPDSTCYYSSLSHNHNDTNLRSCSIAKIDLHGNLIDVYEVVYGYAEGKLSYAHFLNDSILAASAGWGNTDDSLWSRAVIFDTLGNLLNSRVLVEDLYTSILQLTYDGKLVYASNTYQNGQFDCLLTKLNKNLEDDTIYTFPFMYDSLCPYQIVSDTIVQDDCGLIVGIAEEEKGRRGEEERMIEVWPNPCSTVLSVSLASQQSAVGSGQSNEKTVVEIFDVFGRKVGEETLSSTRMGGGREGGWTIDVSTLPPGLYLLVVKDEERIVGTAKFIVAR